MIHGPGVCSCRSGYQMISPSVRSRRHVLCSQDAEEIDGNRHQVEIGQNKSSIFRNNLEILFLELGNSVLKFCF